MKKSAIIVAGGTGKRMGTDQPKQFIPLNSQPLLFHAIKTFYKYNSTIDIVTVLPEQYFTAWEKLCDKHDFSIPNRTVAGGKTRFHSVKKGLSLIDDEGLVAVHDAARPLVSKDLIARSFKTAEREGSAVPCIPVNDSLRKVVNHTQSVAVPRSAFKLVQTPQCFPAKLLKEGYQKKIQASFTDEATVVEALGKQVKLIDGEVTNIKVTYPADLKHAEFLLNNSD